MDKLGSIAASCGIVLPDIHGKTHSRTEVTIEDNIAHDAAFVTHLGTLLAPTCVATPPIDPLFASHLVEVLYHIK